MPFLRLLPMEDVGMRGVQPLAVNYDKDCESNILKFVLRKVIRTDFAHSDHVTVFLGKSSLLNWRPTIEKPAFASDSSSNTLQILTTKRRTASSALHALQLTLNSTNVYI